MRLSGHTNRYVVAIPKELLSTTKWLSNKKKSESSYEIKYKYKKLFDMTNETNVMASVYFCQHLQLFLLRYNIHDGDDCSWHVARDLRHRVFVELVLSESRTNSLQVCDVLGDLVNGLNLFSQVVGLDEITHLSVTVRVGNLVQVEQSLVYMLLQIESRLHGFESCTPVTLLWWLDGFEHDASASLILELHKLLSMFSLFIGCLSEVLGEVTQSDIISVHVECH